MTESAKLFCSFHVTLHPYVRDLVSLLEDRELKRMGSDGWSREGAWSRVI
jgi:hypothetical protein